MNYFHWNIDGWVSPAQEEIYRQVVDSASNSAHFVEIGCWKGRSTAMMAVNIVNSGKSIKFDAIDHFKGSQEHQPLTSITNESLLSEFLKNIEPVKDIVNLVVEDSSLAASRYLDKSIDFVFIDGDHSYEGVHKDIQAWLPKIKEGGIIAGDDFNNIDFPGVANAVIDFFSDVSLIDNVWFYKIPKQVRHVNIVKQDEGVNLNYNYEREIEGAYIICVENNSLSNDRLKLSTQALERAGMKYTVFYGYDGSDEKQIKTPEHLKDKDYMRWIKKTDHMLSYPEIGCALSHMALWAHCMTIDKPIVILEHDAIMLQPYTHFPFYNAFHYLGHKYIALEAIQSNNLENDYCFLIDYLNDNPEQEVLDHPMLNYSSENWWFPMGHHAYAIDPAMAKRLFTHYLQQGLKNVNDVMQDSFIFECFYTKLYATQAFDSYERSTIGKVIENGRRKNIFTTPGVSL